jgi:DNA-binding transcriptional LysR family regulator
MAFAPLQALSVFVAVARQRSFTAAAKQLNVSPSAVSQSVRQLETRLGQSLLTRTTRTVALTDAGRRLLESAGPAVAQASEALTHATARPGEVVGRVRLSIPHITAPFLEPIVPRFLERHPHVALELVVEDSLVDIVDSGYDAGVRLSEAIERDMIQVRLTEPFRFLIVGSPGYLARRGRPARPRDLLAHDAVCFRGKTSGALYQWELERGRKVWRVPVRGSVTVSDAQLMAALAERGVGLAYVAEFLVRERLARGSLVSVLEEYAATVPGFFLYYPSRAKVSSALRAFVDVAKEVTRGAVARR